MILKKNIFAEKFAGKLTFLPKFVQTLDHNIGFLRKTKILFDENNDYNIGPCLGRGLQEVREPILAVHVPRNSVLEYQKEIESTRKMR
jgi:hypothetical protein